MTNSRTESGVKRDHILIIEDDRTIQSLLAAVLSERGYAVDSRYTGTDGLNAAKGGDYALVLLDIMLPYKSGDRVLAELRKESDVPVIVISAKDMVGTKIDLLRLGADDYVTKPFDIDEVAARVEANIRRFRKKQSADCLVSFEELTLNSETKRVFLAGTEVELTAREYQLMELFIKNPEKVFSKANLYESVWGEEYFGDDNTVKTHISNLRGRLKDAAETAKAEAGDYIETVWGLGYRLKKRG